MKLCTAWRSSSTSNFGYPSQTTRAIPAPYPRRACATLGQRLGSRPAPYPCHTQTRRGFGAGMARVWSRSTPCPFPSAARVWRGYGAGHLRGVPKVARTRAAPRCAQFYRSNLQPYVAGIAGLGRCIRFFLSQVVEILSCPHCISSENALLVFQTRTQGRTLNPSFKISESSKTRGVLQRRGFR